ncbi:MAG: malate dehydrogenase [Gammaproteobacteria bacterium]|nr:malate dehydrogenase [Gammaproteobacteria bacterium]
MSLQSRKIALVGGGQIGIALALMITQKDHAEVVIVDLPGMVDPIKGKALDIMALRPHAGVDVEITATSDYAEIADAEVVIITAGIPRKAGMSRNDLLEINKGVIESIAKQVAEHAPNAFVVLSTNPVDTMCQIFHKTSGFPKERVIGLSGALDSGRFRLFIAMETRFSAKDVSCMVMGGHGPAMIPLTRTATVGGIPIQTLLSEEKIEEIVDRTRHAGTEIVQLLGHGSAYISPASAIMEMVEAYLYDKKRLISSSVLCEGEYGIDDCFIGVPCVIGSGGMERIVEMELTEGEQTQLQHNYEILQENLEKLE